MLRKKSAAAVELGRKGGKASAEKLTYQQRKEKARKAAQAKWAKKKAAPAARSLVTGAEIHARARRLTNRERQVAQHAAEGRSNNYIARQLRIGVNTVKKHISQALEKLGASNRTELAFLLRDELSQPEKLRESSLSHDFMAGVVLEAAKEAYETAEYLVKQGRPRSDAEMK